MKDEQRLRVTVTTCGAVACRHGSKAFKEICNANLCGV